MQRRIKLRIRNLRLGLGQERAAQLASGMGPAISRALAGEKPGIGNAVSEATAREMGAKLSSRAPVGKRR